MSKGKSKDTTGAGAANADAKMSPEEATKRLTSTGLKQSVVDNILKNKKLTAALLKVLDEVRQRPRRLNWLSFIDVTGQNRRLRLRRESGESPVPGSAVNACSAIPHAVAVIPSAATKWPDDCSPAMSAQRAILLSYIVDGSARLETKWIVDF